MIDYAKEAASILDMLPEQLINQIPVAVYNLAKLYDIEVLVKNNDVEVDGNGDSDIKANLTVPELLEKNMQDEIPAEWKKSSFILFLNEESSVVRRLLTAYYIAFLHLFSNQLITIDSDLLTKTFFLKTINTRDNPMYTLALYILVPNGALEEMMRENGLDYQAALQNDEFIEKIVETFLVARLDVVNRLEAAQS